MRPASVECAGVSSGAPSPECPGVLTAQTAPVALCVEYTDPQLQLPAQETSKVTVWFCLGCYAKFRPSDRGRQKNG